MFGDKGLVERFHLFERNKFSYELKILGLAFYIQISARALSECRGFLRLLL